MRRTTTRTHTVGKHCVTVLHTRKQHKSLGQSKEAKQTNIAGRSKSYVPVSFWAARCHRLDMTRAGCPIPQKTTSTDHTEITTTTLTTPYPVQSAASVCGRALALWASRQRVISAPTHSLIIFWPHAPLSQSSSSWCFKVASVPENAAKEGELSRAAGALGIARVLPRSARAAALHGKASRRSLVIRTSTAMPDAGAP